tara:strand:- start:1494 stop:2264 length:771 start_codon:yes stop_codon:yes gene_type:complete
LGEANPMCRKFGQSNPNFVWWYCTNDGIFDSSTTMGLYYKVDRNTILHRYKNLDIPIKRSRWHPKQIWGKTWRELGWIRYRSENMNYEEICEKLGCQPPRIIRFTNKEDILEQVQNLPELQEGFVLFDREGKPTLKIKSQQYVRFHRMRGETRPTPKRIMDILFINEQDEYLSIFPEDKPLFQPYENAFQSTSYDFDHLWSKFGDIADQKEFAMNVKQYSVCGLLFKKKQQPELTFLDCFNMLLTATKYKLLEKYV